MKKMIKEIWSWRSSLVFALTPLALLPLPLIVKKSEAYCAYCILIMAVYWITEVIPMAVTSFIPIVLFPLTGIMSAKQTSSAFLLDPCWLFLGGLTIALAVEDTGLHKRIALQVLLLFGTSPRSLMLGFMVSSALLSMWISNTATTAMIIPIAEAVLVQLDQNYKELDEKEDHEQDAELQKLDNFQSKEKKKSSSSAKKTNLIFKGITICVPYASSVGGIATLTGSPPNLILSGQYQILYPKNDMPLTFGSWIAYSLPMSIVMLLFGYLWLVWCFIGFQGVFARTSNRLTNKRDEKVRSVLQDEYEKLGRISWGEASVLVIFGMTILLWLLREWNSEVFSGWGSLFPNNYSSDSTAAMAMAILLYILPSKRPKFLGGDGQDKPSKPIMTWDIMQRKFPWVVMFLFGGGFVIAKGAEVSGLSVWIGNQLALMDGIPAWAICLVTTIIAGIFTEVTSNTATAAILLPILSQMAQATRIHPLYILIPATLATSLAFMLPVATPPNAIAFSYGRLKVMDLIKSGWLMNIVGMFVINFFINTYGVKFFNLRHFPQWALQNNITTATPAI